MSSDANKYEARVTKMTVGIVGEPTFDELAIDIEIEDEAGGEYLVLTPKGEALSIVSVEHWAVLRDAIDKMIATLRDN